MIKNDTIYDWVKYVTGYPDDNVIRAKDPGPRPVGEYATYYLVAAVPSDHAWEEQKLSDDKLFVEKTYYNRVRLTVTVDIYAEDGDAKLLSLAQSGNLYGARIILRAAGLSFIGGGGVRELAEPGDVEYGPRYNADFDFYWYSEIGETIDRILEMILGGTFEDDQGNEDEVEVEVFKIEVGP